ncbi:MAG: hypothetical protein K6E49_07065 [Lachnospiraceae bacterium]|nr:hypothetical protein [Lachnospiraceae bacterium]
MSELEKLEQKIVSLFEENDRSMDQRFKSIDDRFKSIDDRFKSIDDRLEDIEIDIKAIGVEMETESKRIQDAMHNEIQKLGERVHNLEVLAHEKWDVPELKDRMYVLEHVVSTHSDQIQVLNEKVGIVAG